MFRGFGICEGILYFQQHYLFLSLENFLKGVTKRVFFKEKDFNILNSFLKNLLTILKMCISRLRDFTPS